MKNIQINGVRHKVSEDELTFGEIVGMSGHEVRCTPSVTYQSVQASGILTPGDQIDVTDGMLFYISYTGNA